MLRAFFICYYISTFAILKIDIMKKILFSLALVLTIAACNQKPEGYTINGNITGEVENGTKVFLGKRGENNQRMDIDTTTVENGKFVFTGTAENIEIHFIYVDQLMGYTALVLENGEIEYSVQKDSVQLAKIKGTPQNDMFADYMEGSLAMQKRAMSIQEDIQKARLSKDEASITSLGDEMSELTDEAKNFDLDFIKKNPSSLISVLLIDKAMATRTVPLEEIQTLYGLLDSEILETRAAKSLQEKITAMKAREENGKSTSIGAKAPNFSAPAPDGKDLALADILGKVTLIDFWAAWCRPCRAENPNVVKVYEKYHEKGLNIIGVSLDKKAEDWKKAIETDGLTWNHVSNIAYFNDPIAKLYNVDAIPAAFLLDENGVIVAKNLRGADLEKRVAELLN